MFRWLTILDHFLNHIPGRIHAHLFSLFAILCRSPPAWMSLGQQELQIEDQTMPSESASERWRNKFANLIYLSIPDNNHFLLISGNLITAQRFAFKLLLNSFLN